MPCASPVLSKPWRPHPAATSTAIHTVVRACVTTHRKLYAVSSLVSGFSWSCLRRLRGHLVGVVRTLLELHEHELGDRLERVEHADTGRRVGLEDRPVADPEGLDEVS